MPPFRHEGDSTKRGHIRGCFRAKTLLLATAGPDNPPPPVWADLFFWGCFLDLGGACGYVAADFMRGYFNANPDASNQLYQVLGAAFVVESLCFALSWRQASYRVGFWPHMATEYLNIFSCLIYLTTASMYGYRGGRRDAQTIAIGNAVVWLEAIAAGLFLVDACLYWWVWCVDNLEAEEEAAGLHGAEGRVCARHTWLIFRRSSCRNVEMQEHVWNVIPSAIYIFAAGASVWLQMHPVLPPMVTPLPAVNDTAWVPAATCFPNVPYPAGTPPPCRSSRVFNAPCPVPTPGGGVAVCWEEQSYAPGALCGSEATNAFCVADGRWTPPPRNGSVFIANGTRQCFRRGAYGIGDACAAPGLWPGLSFNATLCAYLPSLEAGSRAPCNDPALWGRFENRTFPLTPPPPRHSSIGELEALRLSARIYVLGDALFALDAAIVLWAWVLYARDRKREYREYLEGGGDGGGGGGGGGAWAPPDASSSEADEEEEDDDDGERGEEEALAKPAAAAATAVTGAAMPVGARRGRGALQQQLGVTSGAELGKDERRRGGGTSAAAVAASETLHLLRSSTASGSSRAGAATPLRHASAATPVTGGGVSGSGSGGHYGSSGSLSAMDKGRDAHAHTTTPAAAAASGGSRTTQSPPPPPQAHVGGRAAPAPGTHPQAVPHAPEALAAPISRLRGAGAASSSAARGRRRSSSGEGLALTALLPRHERGLALQLQPPPLGLGLGSADRGTNKKREHEEAAGVPLLSQQQPERPPPRAELLAPGSSSSEAEEGERRRLQPLPASRGGRGGGGGGSHLLLKVGSTGAAMPLYGTAVTPGGLSLAPV